MTTEANATPDLPALDPSADRGNSFEPEGAATPVELSADDLKVIGREAPSAEAAKEPAAEGAKTEGDDAAKEPAKAEDKADAKPDDKPRDKEGKFIPKARFDEVNRKAKAKVESLERQVADLKTRVGMTEGQTADVAALEKQLEGKSEEYGKLIADGDLTQANAVMKEMNLLNRRIATAETLALTSTHTTESHQVASLGEMVDFFKDAYPVFDDQADTYNQEYVDFVAKWQGRAEMAGSSPAEALREAVELAVSRFNLDGEPAKEEVKPDKGKERKAAETAKSVAAANAQAPALSSLGLDSDKVGMSKINVDSLSYEEFEKLPESTKSRLRGDNT